MISAREELLSQIEQQSSSEISKLQSALQQAQKKLQEQSDQIVRLSGADLILQDNERLKEENERLRNEKDKTEKRAAREAEAAKAKAQLQEEALKRREAVAEQKQQWTHDNIGYYDNTPKVDETDGAYRGIVQRKGDCYTYAMTSKCLLTRAGIRNQDIGTIPNNPHLHFWNLVYLDGAWRHFDATRRADKSEFFLTPDSEVYTYSESHDGTHRYNPSLYPEIA